MLLETIPGVRYARTSGGYSHHQRRTEPHAAVLDPQFQHQLLDELARFTSTRPL